MGTVKENLIAARALIDTPEKWIRYEDKRGDCYCAIGAIRAIAGLGGTSHVDLYSAIVAALPDGEEWIARFNDDPKTTHADIMALFTRAIGAQP